MFNKFRYIDNTLSEDDIFKFYTLLNHYSETAPNIGVVGDNRKFERCMRLVRRKYRNTNGLIYVQDEEHLRIMGDELDINYIHIKDLYDLEGYMFKKYM